MGLYFELKEESIAPPYLYLDGKMSQIVLKNGAKAWNFGSEKQVKVDVSNVEEYLYKKGETIPY